MPRLAGKFAEANVLMDPRSTDCEKKERSTDCEKKEKRENEMRNVIALGNAEVKATKCIRKEKRENEFIVY